jgi:PAS domain S-box-containing protein
MITKKVQLIDRAELRRLAEERLKENKMAVPPPGKVEDALRLLHELQVHQIELEIQNDELRQARDEVESVLEKYADVYDFAPVGYFTLDRNGSISAANLTGSALIGVERSRLIGRNFSHLVVGKARSAFADFLAKVFTSQIKETCETVLQKEGNYPFFVQIEAVAADSGEEYRVAVIDITERKRAEDSLVLSHRANEALRLSNEANEALLLAKKATEALRLADETTGALRLAMEAAESLRLANDANETLRLSNNAIYAIILAKEAASELRLVKESAEAAAKTKNQFFANMSHELRTPMTGILGMLELALEEDPSPTMRGYLETVLGSAQSLLDILNDILDMAKIEAGKFTIVEKPFSPRKCITEAVNFINPKVRQKGLDLTVSVAEEVPDTVVGDKLRLRQILINLIGNAVKFTGTGKVMVGVTAGATASNGMREFVFEVTDTGIGIPVDKKDRLFQSFSQADESHSRIYGGTGLGLAISKEIVELMGGTMSFESEEGVGSTFFFTVLLRESELDHANDIVPATPVPVESVTVCSGESKKSRLLLAEDDPVIRQLLKKILQRSNFDLDIAEDGRKAVEMWEQGEYDLILMDIQMPFLDGFAATRAIREKEHTYDGGHTLIVAMTAHASKDDEQKCLDAGMDAFISKPIDLKASITLIGDLIKQKSSGAN